jgi:crotonobetainyl-CoA:carnitine CoA-transferase CaiB-like acyl-CoA transferase
MLLADAGADVVRREQGDFVWNRGKRVGDLSGDDADVIVSSGDFAAPNRSTVVLQLPSSHRMRWAGGRESEGLVAASMGISLRQYSFDGGPIDSIVPIATMLQGIWGAACAVAALVERERSGLGQLVTVSGEHGAMVASGGALTFRHADIASPPARRLGSPGGSVPFYRTYRCADGEWLFFGALIPNFTRIGFEVLGLSDLFDDPRLEGRGRAAMLRPEHAPWVTETIAARFATAPRDGWVSKLRAAGCPVGAVLQREHWLDHPQVDAIGMHERVSEDAHRPGVPFDIEQIVDAATTRERGSSAAADQEGPLRGIRILDLGAIIAGPFSASLLGELGADVIKVEPLTGDSFRGPGFAAYNKGQRSIALDLRDEIAHGVFDDLVRTADIVIDNYRPGVLGRLGIDHASLRRINPGVISASITGFGDRGPYGSDAGFDPILQAMSGMMKAQGGESDPVFYTVPVNDVAASAVIAFACAVALFGRMRTGRTGRVSTSLAAMSVLLQTEAIARYEGRPASASGSRDHLGASPRARFYRASDGWVRIDTDDLGAIGEDRVSAWISSRTRAEAVDELNGLGIAAAPARTIAELASDAGMYDAQILQRDARTDREGSTAGRHAFFSRTMRTGMLVSPALGEHTRELLTELGYDDTRIEEIVSSPGVGAQELVPG